MEKLSKNQLEEMLQNAIITIYECENHNIDKVICDLGIEESNELGIMFVRETIDNYNLTEEQEEELDRQDKEFLKNSK